MSGVTGRALRDLREHAGLGLRRIASRSALPVSVGHLSRVERGERRVTPAIVAAYEQAIGVRIQGPASGASPAHGAPDEQQREAFLATLGRVAAGGSPAESASRLLEVAAGDLAPPTRIGLAEVAHLEQATIMIRQLDLRFGGGLVWQLAEPLLRWAVGLHTASMRETTRVRLERAIGGLSGTAAWAAFDDGRERATQALFTMALAAARRIDDADLRAHVMADAAAHYNYLGHPDKCLTVLRLEGDERVGPAVQCVLHGVRAHAYAATGQPDACARQTELAQVTSAAMEHSQVPYWLGGFDPAHTLAVCGQAAAVLAGVTGRGADRAAARARLSDALPGLAAAGRVRAMALCQLRITMLELAEGDSERAAQWARQAVTTAAGLRSRRVRHDLAVVREAAGRLDEQVSGALDSEVADQVQAATAPPP